MDGKCEKDAKYPLDNDLTLILLLLLMILTLARTSRLVHLVHYGMLVYFLFTHIFNILRFLVMQTIGPTEPPPRWGTP